MPSTCSASSLARGRKKPQSNFSAPSGSWAAAREGGRPRKDPGDSLEDQSRVRKVHGVVVDGAGHGLKEKVLALDHDGIGNCPSEQGNGTDPTGSADGFPSLYPAGSGRAWDSVCGTGGDARACRPGRRELLARQEQDDQRLSGRWWPLCALVSRSRLPTKRICS